MATPEKPAIVPRSLDCETAARVSGARVFARGMVPSAGGARVAQSSIRTRSRGGRNREPARQERREEALMSQNRLLMALTAISLMVVVAAPASGQEAFSLRKIGRPEPREGLHVAAAYLAFDGTSQ